LGRIAVKKTGVIRLASKSPEKVQPNGEYTIYVLKGTEWQEAGRLAFDRFLRMQKIDLGRFLPGKAPAQIKLVQSGGGAAHIDAVSLGEKPLTKITGTDDSLAIKKLMKRDNDVMNAFARTLALTFPENETDKTLRLTARVEPETVSKIPFQFPSKNLF